MNTTLISVLAIVLVANVVLATAALPPYVYGDGYAAEEFGGEVAPASVDGTIGGDRGGSDMAAFENRLLQGLNKRSCIRRGSRCDHRPDDCCSGGACRCNLWGSNCQCQRMGIFQKWG